MKERALGMYQREVERQCAFAVMAYEDLQSALLGYDEEHTRRAWFSVQALLVALGNVSKLLRSPRERLPGRSARLRESLLVDDGSPILDRDLRNDFEHFDERLDTWVQTSPDLYFADSNIGHTPGKGVIFAFAEHEYLRNIYRTEDPKQLAITFRGKSYDLLPVMDEIRALRVRSEAGRWNLEGAGGI